MHKCEGQTSAGSKGLGLARRPMRLRAGTGHRGTRWLSYLPLLALLWFAGAAAQERPREGGVPGAVGAGAAPGALEEPPPAETAFTLLGAPIGAEVTVDGQLVGTTPLQPRSPVSPGLHQLRVTRLGYSTYTQEFTAFAGRLVALELTMISTHMLLRLRTGEVAAQVFVGDELRGETPLELTLLPGLHQVTVRGPNIQDESFTVTAVAGEQAERDVQVRFKPEQRQKEQAARPKERRFYSRWWVWTLASIGAVGIATAIIVPTVLSQRSSCEKLGGEVCFPIDLAMPALRSPLVVRF